MKRTRIKIYPFCKRCGKNYRFQLSKYCLKCKKEIEKDRLKVKKQKERIKLRKQKFRERKAKAPARLKKQCDELFSKIIRLRDKKCLKCGTNKNLQVAHLISRKNLAHRWDENSAITLCYACHLYWYHKEPIEAAEWLKRLFPNFYDYVIKHKGDLVLTNINYLELKEKLSKRLNEFQ